MDRRSRREKTNTGSDDRVHFVRTEDYGIRRNNTMRVGFTALLILFELLWLFILFTRLEIRWPWIATVIGWIGFALILTVNCRFLNSSYRMFWITFIAGFPILGVFCYAVYGRRKSRVRVEKTYAKISKVLNRMKVQPEGVTEKLDRIDARQAGTARYLQHTCGYPLYGNTDVVYYSDALPALEAQLEDLKKAKDFIFMEYHAIERGGAFERIFHILQEKAEEGVEVRVFFDDIGSAAFLDKSFTKMMEEAGILCRDFNPVSPIFNIFMDNRDHRKITVIDGRIGYTGGYNLANEYFHITEPFGFWKDTGVRIAGDAVRSLTIQFLEMWNAMKNTDRPEDVSRYFPKIRYRAKETGFVQPFGDTPLDDEPTGEEVFMNILRTAKNYVYFSTPYLLITDEFRREMTAAAKRGVDVRIVTPGIPDKKMIYEETRAYYAGLIMGGVRIFEYTPGFNHAKLCVSDDRAAVVGTFNLDYRSLYLHFENGILFHHCSIAKDVRKDMEEMFAVSEEVTEKFQLSNQSLPVRMRRGLLRILGPLL